MPLYKKWKHPNMPGTLTTEASQTPEEILDTYVSEGADPSLLQSEAVEMTEAEFDAQPEFQG